jgi:hypothetical protein
MVVPHDYRHHLIWGNPEENKSCFRGGSLLDDLSLWQRYNVPDDGDLVTILE